MRRKNVFTTLVILVIFILAALVIFPLGEGVLFSRGVELGLDLQGGLRLVYEADLSGVAEGSEEEILNGVVAVITNRINPLGVSEPQIEKQGDNRIIVSLPGLEITDVEKERIGRTALLEFRELKDTDNDGTREWVTATGEIDGEAKALNSSYFKDNTFVTVDDFNNILLIFEFNAEGAELSRQITTRLIGEQLGIFEGDEPMLGEDGRPIAPTVQSVISDRGQITGLSLNEATTLSQQLNAGRLPVPLEVIYEQTVSPTLGSDFVGLSLKAGTIGLLLVMLFMIAYYRIPGAVASLALIFYAAITLALFKLIPVTLTLAGIGGFILSIGMAVDANVLIFERIKEELQAGRTLGSAIEAGFSRAWSAIRDSNITTFIVCAILFWVGSSVAAGAPVQGFAVTLFLGVAVSMFTAIVVTRTILRLFIGSRLAGKKWLFSPFLGGNK
ncbi:MAG: protein translocase subunit SecD [Dehalococcoidaceae bacterium]|nr:protein translocase subunit SecD [Dehalococcoidaceae bacterium]